MEDPILSYSYNKRGQQDSDFINQMVKQIIDLIEPYKDLKITIGGGISHETYTNEYLIKIIAPKLSYIETRNVILNSSCINDPSSLEYALDFEKSYLNFKISKKRIFTRFDEERFNTLNLRG